jgi:hypothetical protein
MSPELADLGAPLSEPPIYAPDDQRNQDAIEHGGDLRILDIPVEVIDGASQREDDDYGDPGRLAHGYSVGDILARSADRSVLSREGRSGTKEGATAAPSMSHVGCSSG